MDKREVPPREISCRRLQQRPKVGLSRVRNPNHGKGRKLAKSLPKDLDIVRSHSEETRVVQRGNPSEKPLGTRVKNHHSRGGGSGLDGERALPRLGRKL
jgi:hypothetical protein